MEKEIKIIKRNITPILNKYKIVKAGLFGSYARGNQKKNSDIDILIEIKRELDLIEMIQLKNLIEKKLNKKVDLVEYKYIRKEIKEKILREEVPLLR